MALMMMTAFGPKLPLQRDKSRISRVIPIHFLASSFLCFSVYYEESDELDAIFSQENPSF